MSHKCQGNLRAYIFLSPVSFIQDTLDYVRQPTTTINTIMSSKQKMAISSKQESKSMQIQKEIKKEKEKEISKIRKKPRRPTFLAEKELTIGNEWKMKEKASTSPLKSQENAQSHVGVLEWGSKVPKNGWGGMFWKDRKQREKKIWEVLRKLGRKKGLLTCFWKLRMRKEEKKYPRILPFIIICVKSP